MIWWFTVLFSAHGMVWYDTSIMPLVWFWMVPVIRHGTPAKVPVIHNCGPQDPVN